jgi:hypothetical protein
MRIGLSFAALASSAMLVLLGVSGAAQARVDIGESQALSAQMRDVMTAALWYPAGANYFNKQYQSLAKQFRALH